MRRGLTFAVLGFCFLASPLWVANSSGGEWTRFRGPNGSGVENSKSLPTTFGSDQNLKWKTALPGPGSSSPIIVGDKVFVTCWSGYAMDRQGDPGNLQDLRLHLVCLDRNSGKILWDKSIESYQPEEVYRGMFAEHGYASHTPTSDGERVYAYFGKTGAVAFDLNGKQLWQKQVGTEKDPMDWGSASSPILYKDLLIITASAECEGLVALNKLTGEQVWRKEARGLSGTWGTPVLVKVDDERTDLVIAVPGEIWGLNPKNGKLRWYCDGISERSYCSSLVAEGDVVYGIEGMGGGSIAVRAGGSQDVSSSHVLWRGRDNNRISTPLMIDGRLYFFASRTARCIDAKDDKLIYQARLRSGGSNSESAEVADADDSDRGGRGRGGFGGGRGGFGGGGFGGGMGGQDYSSPVAADGKIYFTSRQGDIYVIQAGPEFKQLAVNRLTAAPEDFSASPAISDGALFIRSNKYLYCVAEN